MQEAMGNNRKNVAAAAAALHAILTGTDVPFGERSNCYSISDTMIVLESPPDSEVYSTDGDVHAICEILRKTIYSEEPLVES